MLDGMQVNEKVRGAVVRTQALLQKGWTQGAWCRDHGGGALTLGNTGAACWCLTAALRMESDGPTLAIWHGALRAVYRAVRQHDGLAPDEDNTPTGMELALQTWNDIAVRTRADVLKAPDHAAAGIS